MAKKILLLGTIFGMLSVLFGAFGAHGLKALVSEQSVISFNTGVRYQMYHALLLLFIGSTSLISEAHKKKLFYLIGIGVLLFSGSIYALATNSLTAFNFKTIGFITPIGGTILLISWGVLIVNFLKIKNK